MIQSCSLKSAIKSALQRTRGPLRPLAERILSSRRKYNSIYVVCDQPDQADPRPLTGEIAIRGACFTLRPDDAVEIRVGNLPAFRVKPALNQRDDRSPNLTPVHTGRSNFTACFDSSLLADGFYPIRIHLISGGKAIRKTSAGLHIDHQRGFASDYERWIEDFERPSRETLAQRLPAFAYLPRFLMLAAAPPQSYPNYVVASRADLPESDYVCWLEKGTTLLPDALAFVVDALNAQPEADFLYGDDDEIDAQRRRSKPFFKPSWSPDLALSFNYAGGLLVLRRDLFDAMSDAIHFASGYDFMLQAGARASHIVRVPHVLTHRAKLSAPAIAPAIDQAGGIEPGRVPGTWRARYPIPPETALSIIIASGGGVGVLDVNLRSLVSMNAFQNFEIVVIDNSRDDQIRQYLLDRERMLESRLRWLDCRHQPFNYSKLNNYAAAQCASEALLFLNDDTSAAERNWIEAMLELALRPEVGAVGAKLLYPSGPIQHAGVVMGIVETCGHALKTLSGDAPHYFGLSDVIRNVSAVTGACLMTRRAVFEAVGGLDETAFPVAFNDVDLCLRIGRAGYRILYTPYAVLYHHEAFSKSAQELIPANPEVAALRERWGYVIADDPYYNPNLTRKSEDYTLPRKRPK